MSEPLGVDDHRCTGHLVGELVGALDGREVIGRGEAAVDVLPAAEQGEPDGGDRVDPVGTARQPGTGRASGEGSTAGRPIA